MRSYYGDINEQLLIKLSKVKLLVCDVDGVFSDGRIYLGNNGEELKAFHTRDGHGIKALVNKDIKFAVITGRQSNIVERRMTELGACAIIQNQLDKLPALTTLAEKLALDLSQIAYLGDDLPDLPCLKKVGLACAVKDAHPKILSSCYYQTTLPGGFGAVRELCDLIMQVQGLENE
jgi:3-deoxy-D-manno-octulosonate 8-phosphate phosphatase (KDO 8-P phosphatase)